MISIRTKVFLLFIFLVWISNLNAQSNSKDSLDYKIIYGLAVKGEADTVIRILETKNNLNSKDSLFKIQFLKRFKSLQDEEISPEAKPLSGIIKLFQDYWRKGLLNSSINYDSLFLKDIIIFMKKENNKLHFTESVIGLSTISAVYTQYLDHKGFHTTEFGKTGKFYDLIVWKTMYSRQYTIHLPTDTIHVSVNFISNSISLGWLEFARMGNYYPGGWATKEGLYCVEKGYDTLSEKFTTTFLKHEAQHFSDYRKFPGLMPGVLEYRSKLVEMYYNEFELYNRLENFINNAKNDSTNAHPYANYYVIKNLSLLLFNKEWEPDLSKWKALSRLEIHNAAITLLNGSTKNIKKGLQGTFFQKEMNPN